MKRHITSRDSSAIMRAVRSKDTQIEVALRSELFRRGYRYRLHRRDLPGCPDIVFPRRRKVIFVHGCFWHQHQSCGKALTPSVNQSYWIPKLAKNVSRDIATKKRLKAEGWCQLTIWECQMKNLARVIDRAVRFLER